MDRCLKCNNKNTIVCNSCDNGSLWVETKDSFHLIISAIMIGCGIGGILAALYVFYTRST